MEKKLKIVSVSSEVEPFSKTGGLANVTASLPIALKKLGHEVIVITPLYEAIIDKKKFNLKMIFQDIEMRVDERTKIKVNFWQGILAEKIPVYFIENKKYFSRHKRLYGSQHENARFFIFNLASLKLLLLLKFPADIIQCHDWHTGLIPYFLKKDFSKDVNLENTASLYTIHNLTFQFGHNWWKVPNGQKDNGHIKLPLFQDPNLENINFAKRGILNADFINTVSEAYAEEILTKDFGEDLHRILQNRQERIVGIINGIDYKDYNPEQDPGLARRYNSQKIHRKIQNKIALQAYFNLPQNPETPVLGMVSRITEQKGFDLIMEVIEPLLRQDLQFIIMGEGDKKYIQFFQKIQKRHPRKFIVSDFKANKETSIYAGADMVVLPSRFEPCGLIQLISLRYGCIPIVRAIGGLAETVTNFNPKTGKGFGFVFKTYDSRDLLMTVTRALETYKYQKIWQGLVKKGMQQSFSWEIPAKKYVTLFRKAIKIKKTNQKKNL